MIFIVPLIMYLAVTAITLTCPIKALVANYMRTNLPELQIEY
jgi:hypothetical protein